MATESAPAADEEEEEEEDEESPKGRALPPSAPGSRLLPRMERGTLQKHFGG